MIIDDVYNDLLYKSYFYRLPDRFDSVYFLINQIFNVNLCCVFVYIVCQYFAFFTFILVCIPVSQPLPGRGTRTIPKTIN